MTEIGTEIQSSGARQDVSSGKARSPLVFGILGVLVGAALVYGMQQQAVSGARPQPTADAPTVTGSASAITSLTAQFGTLKGLVNILNAEVTRLDQYSTATVDPTKKGYSRIDTNNGTFYVVCNDAKPYLNGQRINLQIGNPQDATFSGFELDLSWGQPDPKTFEVKSKTEKLLATLRPGTWTTVQTVLAPATADEIQAGIQLSMSTDRVSLLK